MGTSKERSKDEEEVEVKIPWAFVDHAVRQELIKKLNPDAAVSGNDWRMLANELGYTTSDIRYIESEKDNNTRVLFNQYDTKAGASLNDVYKSLEKMEREDCLEIIRSALPGIHQAFLQAKASESQILHVAETSEMYISRGAHQWSNAPFACPYSHHPTSAYGGHAYYSCGHGFAACGHLGGGTCPSPCHAHLPHPSPSMCQTSNHSSTFEKKCAQSFSSPCHTVSPVNDYILKSQTGCHGSMTRPCGSSSPGRQGNGQSTPGNIVTDHHGCSGLSPGHSGYHGSPTYSYNQNINSMALPNNISVLDNSNLMSSDSSNSDSLNSRQKVARQYSDECNITQASSGDKRFRNNSITRGAVNTREPTEHQGVMSHVANSGVMPRNNQSPQFARPSDAVGYKDHRDKYYQQKRETQVRGFVPEHALDVTDHLNSNKSKTSLALLEKLATVPDKFKPTDEYKTVVAEQKIEMEKRGGDGKGSLDSSSHSSSSVSSSGRIHPSTFPMRVKVKHERGMDDLKNLTISKKSTSMPKNMKPVEYRKAFRHIKVFVTYSFDSESHGKQVLSLCKFLQSNGFACCVDVTEKKSSVNSLEQIEWCRRKVTEADFVLVCISHKYLDDISSPHSATVLAQANERQLHTREIYEMMNTEYLNGQHGCDGESSGCATPRFVPLLFPQMMLNHVPQWMANGPAYAWPKQYKDLAWMLTKPQERIMGRREAHVERLERRNRRSDFDAGDMDIDDCGS